MTEQKRKIQTLVICGLLLLSIIDHTECRKTSSSNKNKSKSGSATTRPKTNNPQQYANPASLSYSGVSPNAPQQPKPSAPKIEQRPVQSLASPVNYPQSNNANSRPVGWDVNSQQRPQSLPYPQNGPPLSNVHNPSNMNQNPSYNPQQPAYNPQPIHNQQPAYNPQPIHNQQPAYNPQQIHNQQPAYNPQPIHNQQPAYNPQQIHNQQPAYNPQQIHNQQPAYQPQQPAYNPQSAYNPQVGYNPQSAYNPQAGYHPQQPQVVPQYVPVQQQSSGPGLLKTVAVGAAAGLGTSLLYNSLTSKDEPKTTVIIVNNTQPIQSAPASQPEAVTTLPIQNNPASVAPIQEQNNPNTQTSAPVPQQIPIQENQQSVPFSPQQPPVQENQPQIYQQIPTQENQPQIYQQIPIQENQQQIYQQPPLQELPQGIIPNQPLINEVQTTIMPINNEGIPQNQTTLAETTTFSATTMPSSSTQDKVLPPVDALSSQVTESANLKDSVSSYEPINTQMSMLVIALSCSISYLIQ